MTKIKAMQGISEGSKRPAHEQVYQRLRDMILFGELAPGQAVTIQGLTGTLGAGMTPVREAIRRLISDGALVHQDNRRVSVPVLGQQDIEELIFLRKTMEPELACLAGERLDTAGIDALERIDTRLDAAIAAGNVEGYLRFNHAFHAALNTAAEAPIMSDLVDRLWLRFGPSLRVVCGRFGTRNLPDRHKELLAALRASDAAAVRQAMLDDVEQGMLLMDGMLSDKTSASDSIDTE
ncbi:GntR family transcriptional regulator [Cribrihabitans sp. XS_ASV171]